MNLQELHEIIYNELRKLGYFRVFDTFYKDEYDCRQFYCTGFLTKPKGYEWLLVIADDNTVDDNDDDFIEKAKFDVYIDLKDSSVWERKDRKMFSGTLKEILDYCRKKDETEIKDGRIYI